MYKKTILSDIFRYWGVVFNLEINVDFCIRKKITDQKSL